MALEATLPLCIRQPHHDELSYLPTATFLLGGHFPSICREMFGSHTVARFCVFTPKLVIPWLLCALQVWQNRQEVRGALP